MHDTLLADALMPSHRWTPDIVRKAVMTRDTLAEAWHRSGREAWSDARERAVISKAV